MRTLKNNAVLRFVRGKVDGAVEQRFVFDDAADFDAAGSRQDDARRGVIDAQRQFGRRKTAEHHGVDCTQARHRQHRDHRFRNHRHVDDNAVAFNHAKSGQHSGGARDQVGEF